MSHLKVCARLKIDEEVGTVMNNTEVFLRVAESERDQYIHVSKALFKQPAIAFSNKTPGSKVRAAFCAWVAAASKALAPVSEEIQERGRALSPAQTRAPRSHSCPLPDPSQGYIKDGESKEINCSLEKSTWRLSLFDQADAPAEAREGDLRAGEVRQRGAAAEALAGHTCLWPQHTQK